MCERKKALVFEPCQYHYTLLGSYAFYLNSLGYEVTLLVSRNCNPENELHGAMHLVSEIIFFGDPLWRDAAEMLFSGRFDLVWITTVNVPFPGEKKNLFDVLGGYPSPRDGLFGTLHDINQASEECIELDRFAQIFTLTNRKSDLPSTEPISLSYYGAPCLGKSLSTPASLLAVGVSVSLCGAMKHIVEDELMGDYTISFIGRRTRFKFWALPIYTRCLEKNRLAAQKQFEGYPWGPLRLIKAIKKLRILGNVDSETMYSLVEETDYLVANFEGQMLDTFSKSRVSGVALLSLGFNVPMLVNESIARSWGFGEDEAIVFPDGRFDVALDRIGNMSEEDYASIQNSLLKKQQSELARSLNAIDAAISKWKAWHSEGKDEG